MFFALLFKRQHLLRQLPIGFWLARPITCASIFYCSFLIGAKKAACIIKQLSDLFFIVSLQIFHQIVEHMPARISAAVCKASKPYPCGQPLCSFLCTKKLPISRKFLKMVEVTGFEPATFWSRTKRATKLRYTSKNGANEGTRTLDLRFTKPLLYRLSHIGI